MSHPVNGNGHGGRNGNGAPGGLVRPMAIEVPARIRWELDVAKARIIRDASRAFAFMLSEPPLSLAMLEVARELDALIGVSS